MAAKHGREISREIYLTAPKRSDSAQPFEAVPPGMPARAAPAPGLRIPVRGRRKTLQKIERIVARASPEEEVFYQDEADVHLNPKIGSTYLKRGQQPVVLTPGKNVKRYIFGALNARTGRIIYGVAERKNAEVFTQFLDFLSSRYRRAKRIHLVLDRSCQRNAFRTRAT